MSWAERHKSVAMRALVFHGFVVEHVCMNSGDSSFDLAQDSIFAQGKMAASALT